MDADLNKFADSSVLVPTIFHKKKTIFPVWADSIKTFRNSENSDCPLK